MSPAELKSTIPTWRKKVTDRARKRRRAHQAAEAKLRKRDRALTDPGYHGGRRLADGLKLACKALGTTTTLYVAFLHLFTITMVHEAAGASTLILIVSGLLYTALTVFAFALAYLFILGMEAVFDNADQTREDLEVGRETLAETKFTGESLAEVAEALVDEDPPHSPAPPRTAPPASPPPPLREHEPAPPEPPTPERPKGGAGSFLPLDPEGDD